MESKKINILGAQILSRAINKYLNGAVQIAETGLTEDGFYIDFYSEKTISTTEFPKLEKHFRAITTSGDKVEEIKKLSKPNKFQKFLIKNNQNCRFIKIGSFEGLCNYDFESKMNKIKFFKLVSVGGVYWQNNAKNDSLTRISGVCFSLEEDFRKWEEFVEEQKKRDHRKIGADMEIFYFDNEIGQGLPIWLSNGQTIKRQIKKFLWNVFEDEGFNFVDTPVLGSKELYIKSGHWDHYKENNFPPLEIDNETFILRPMTCPHHINIYNQKPHSYRDLPHYMCEDSKLHRYESSGGLIGLERVRAMELFDCHVVAKIDDIEKVILKLDKILKFVHEKMEIKIDRIDLSLHDENDKEKYHNDKKMWGSSESQLRNVLKKINYNFVEIKGEAAFYGPKIDYQVKTNLGKIITISTIQLDFLLPERFEMTYIDENNEKQRPVLIHFGVIGTYERFIATLLSQTKGKLPLWLSPIQIDIIPVNNKYHLDYSKKLYENFKKEGMRIRLLDSEDRLAKKIRQSQTSKVPFQIIIGDDEVKNKNLTFRQYSKDESYTVSFKEFIKTINNNKQQ